MPRYHISCPTDSHTNKESFSKQHLVRARTGSGEWGSLYAINDDGGCHRIGRTTRWEPLAAIRARVNEHLGTRKAVA